eukprot:1161972-Pelagomonas_calceolata.AAC.15
MHTFQAKHSECSLFGCGGFEASASIKGAQHRLLGLRHIISCQPRKNASPSGIKGSHPLHEGKQSHRCRTSTNNARLNRNNKVTPSRVYTSS